ncbi:MAG: hypothetical protein JSV09_06255 [Thermoplasmata archaeon]|nr:MAG: hypothetical protein JSV09_06255 [Thermoplasmata archaeon]
MVNRVYIFILIILLCVSTVANSEMEPRIWGEIGYILEGDRIKSGHEASLPDFTPGEKVDESDRWLSTQSAYLELNARVSNRMFVAFDTDLSLSGTDRGTFDNTLKQIYVSATVSDWCMLVFGKQRLKWGTAKVFNAIDKLEEVLDPFSDRRFREGLAGVKSVLIPSEWFSLSLVAMPETELGSSRFATRFDFLVLDTDIGFGVIKYNFDHLIKDPISPTKENSDRYAAFFDIIRYFNNFGLYFECEYRTSREMEYAFMNPNNIYDRFYGFDSKDSVFRVSTGAHYRIERALKMDLLLEYFYNSEGFYDDEAKDFYKAYKDHYPEVLPENFGQFGSFRRHYLYLGLQNIEVTDNLNIGISATANIETLFFNFKPEMEYDIDNKIFISIEYDLFHQYRDGEKYPSLFNFMDRNNSVKLSVTTSF